MTGGFIGKEAIQKALSAVTISLELSEQISIFRQLVSKVFAPPNVVKFNLVGTPVKPASSSKSFVTNVTSDPLSRSAYVNTLPKGPFTHTGTIPKHVPDAVFTVELQEPTGLELKLGVTCSKEW
jgi:hypothetical protein